MYYRIKDHIALRSFLFVPGAYYIERKLPAISLEDSEMDLLLLCDGLHELSGADDENQALITTFLEKGLIEPCQKGEKPSVWSAYRSVPHRHFPKMNLMITGKCNYNCLHCFNAADNAPLMSEWSYEDVLKLLDQAVLSGVQAFTITGGEPMLHPHFLDIIHAIYERHMYVEEINTNGHFITDELLDDFETIGCCPKMKISFDGIGQHDWMRDHKGAEKRALDAVTLCVKRGLDVMIQMQVHLKNLDIIVPSAKLLNELGVKELRLIRTTPVARFLEKLGPVDIPIETYFDRLPEIACDIYEYLQGLNAEERHLEMLHIWQLLEVDLKEGEYSLIPVMYGDGEYKDTYPVCKGNRGMIGVTSTGDLVPCLQMSGYFLENGIHLGNLHENTLEELLSDSAYSKMVTKNLYQLRQINERCNSCEHYERCAGGCRALALLYSKEKEGFWDVDPIRCRFFNEGWEKKLIEKLKRIKENQ